MQAENAAEWGKRERLETDKLALERDNKKLRNEMRDLQDRADRRGRPPPPVNNNDIEVRNLQQELKDKNKVISIYCYLSHFHFMSFTSFIPKQNKTNIYRI